MFYSTSPEFTMLPIAALVQTVPSDQEAALRQPPVPIQTAGPWIANLHGKRGMLLLVGYAPGWYLRLEDPFLQDVADELMVGYVPVQDPLLRRLGLQAPGAYLLNEFGRSLGSWNAGVPQDLRKAFEDVGWRSLEAEMKVFLRSHPERLDVRWRLVQKLWLRVDQRHSQAGVDELASALEEFFRQDGWAQLPPRALPALFPADPEQPSGPLAELAQSRLVRVREVLKRDPEAFLAWEMLAFLTPWSPGPEPRIYRVLEELDTPPALFRNLSDWPGELPLRLAEAQLRRLKDWPGLEAYAAGRRTRLEARFLESTQDLPGPWAARFGDPATPEPRPAFIQEAAGDIGRWQVLEMEAQLEQGHAGSAGTTASLILRNGDPASIAAARGIARRLGAEAVVKSLEE